MLAEISLSTVVQLVEMLGNSFTISEYPFSFSWALGTSSNEELVQLEVVPSSRTQRERHFITKRSMQPSLPNSACAISLQFSVLHAPLRWCYYLNRLNNNT